MHPGPSPSDAGNATQSQTLSALPTPVALDQAHPAGVAATQGGYCWPRIPGVHLTTKYRCVGSAGKSAQAGAEARAFSASGSGSTGAPWHPRGTWPSPPRYSQTCGPAPPGTPETHGPAPPGTPRHVSQLPLAPLRHAAQPPWPAAPLSVIWQGQSHLLPNLLPAHTQNNKRPCLPGSWPPLPLVPTTLVLARILEGATTLAPGLNICVPLAWTSLTRRPQPTPCLLQASAQTPP